MGLRRSGLLMLVGLAALARAADPAEPFISKYGMFNSAQPKIAIESVNEHAARQLFSMIVGQLEAMRDEIGELLKGREIRKEAKAASKDNKAEGVKKGGAVATGGAALPATARAL